MPDNARYIIYVLRCEHSRFYVGQTQDLGRRWQEHVSGLGSVWTRNYKPISIKYSEEVVGRSNADHRENVITSRLKELYGDDFVTGGVYCGEDYRHLGLTSWDLLAARRTM